MKTKHVPIAAVQFGVSDVEISDRNGPDSTSAPFSMVARSAQPIDHPYWGRIIHDLAGFKLTRNKVTVDFNHDEAIGYANKFDVTDEGLKVSGAITPTKLDDTASTVIKKAAAGIPWEASINFGGSGIVLEEVGDEEVAEVNGMEFTGPGVIVREWPLRGIAVTAYGADQWTSTQFSDGDIVAVTFIEKDEAMSKTFAEEVQEKIDDVIDQDKEPVDAEVTEEVTVEAEADIDTEEPEQPELVASGVESDTELTSRKTEGAQFMERFGEVEGAQYFAKGLTFSEAMNAHFLAQKAEIDALKQRLSAAKAGGEPEPLSASQFEKPKKKEPFVTLPWDR